MTFGFFGFSVCLRFRALLFHFLEFLELLVLVSFGRQLRSLTCGFLVCYLFFKFVWFFFALMFEYFLIVGFFLVCLGWQLHV